MKNFMSRDDNIDPQYKLNVGWFMKPQQIVQTQKKIFMTRDDEFDQDYILNYSNSFKPILFDDYDESEKKENKIFMSRDPFLIPDPNKPRLGEFKQNNCGSYMQIVRYGGSHDIDVMILTNINNENHDMKYELVTNRCYRNFIEGNTQSSYDTLGRTKRNRLGETNINYNGSKMTIIEYITNNKMKIRIETVLASGELKTFINTVASYDKFVKGTVDSPYDRSVDGVGYLDIGPYDPVKYPIQYMYWKAMLDRVYNNKIASYKDVTVCCYFHSFQNFCKWFETSYYEFEDERMCLDKDILFKGNKIYSPNTCCFVPQYINTIILKSDNTRGKYPVGVSYNKSKNRFRARLKVNKKEKFLGHFKDPILAFYAYKKAKEKEIKRVADYFMYEREGFRFPQFIRLYKAMYNYTIEIDD